MNLRFEGTFSEVMELEEYPCDVQDLTMSLAFNTRTTGSERETPPLRPRRRDTATAALPHVCLERHACAALTLANATRRVCVSHRTGTLPRRHMPAPVSPLCPRLSPLLLPHPSPTFSDAP